MYSCSTATICWKSNSLVVSWSIVRPHHVIAAPHRNVVTRVGTVVYEYGKSVF